MNSIRPMLGEASNLSQKLMRGEGSNGVPPVVVEVERFLSIKEVLRLTSLSRSTLYREIARANFPKPRKLSLTRVGWLRSEVKAWIAARATGGEG